MNRPSPGQTRQAILDAAERMFARNGYHGTSIREIFKAAHVGAGLMTYYFESKDDLFEQVITRKMDKVREHFFARMTVFSHGPVPSPFALFRFYLEFFFVALPAMGPEMESYWDLMARVSTSYDDPIVSKSLAKLDFIHEAMRAALARSVPHAPPQRIASVLLLSEAAVTTLLAAHGLAGHRLGEGEGVRGQIEFYARTLAAAVSEV